MRALDRTRPLPLERATVPPLSADERERRVRAYEERAAAALRRAGRRRWPSEQSLIFQLRAEAALRGQSLFEP